jgi:acyl carrier protein phosphodiesterase
VNYLAHAYLSFGVPGIVTGNMVSDFVKGKKKLDYPPAIQNGITLHRLIDEFTDGHPATKQAKNIFKPYVGLYAGAFVDVAYDHFLATDENEFTLESLAAFSVNTCKILRLHYAYLPERFAKMLPYMEEQDWLFNYSTLSGIEKSFAGVARRAAYLNSSSTVFGAFVQHRQVLQQYYEVFFPDVKNFALNELKKLTT